MACSAPWPPLAGVLAVLLSSAGLGGCKAAERPTGQAASVVAKGVDERSNDTEASNDEPREGSAASNADVAAPPDLTAPPADAETTASGLVTKVLRPGAGDRTPQAQDRVRVHFTGWKTSGKVINSSRGGEPATFAVREVIAGWAEGLQLMRVGEQRRLWIPDNLSYVRPGRPPSPVVFDIELLTILEGETRPAPPDVSAVPADATRTKSGLAYRVLKPGTGDDTPNAWDRVTLSYAGWSTSGEMFEAASRASFEVAKVIPGWAEVLPRMAVGERARLWIPQSLAYQGRRGRPGGTLVFDLELLSVERRPQPPQAPEELAAPPKSAKTTPSGLAYRRVTKGTGARRPGASSRVRVHYSGWNADGELFDSSLLQGKPKTVPIASVIEGWREALQLMVEGDKVLLWVPEKLAYRGAAGAPAGMLVYELELLQIID